MAKTTLEYRMMMEHHHRKTQDSKSLTGSIVGKFPITLDGGKTTIFISDLSKEAEIRERYELRKSSMANFLVKRPKP
jgi:hypothetical protein